MTIYLCSIGKALTPEIEVLKAQLPQVLRAGVETAQPHSLAVPEQAFSRRRNQYHSTMLLMWADAKIPRGQRPLLALTEVDLFVEGLNFVFGEADPGRRVAIVSTHRLRWSYGGGAVPPGQYESRLVKEAVHELGHVFGLGHCPDPGCVMYFSNSILDTDRKGKDFCPRCRAKLSGR
ncbi:MAG: archaemetzincin family Zn-dependent metalloprotease [candidate division KSB1 bacterium]|nr:archaemetzincin family Zn-dependent metalloprotease [candidate division KSB1 bacterium]